MPSVPHQWCFLFLTEYPDVNGYMVHGIYLARKILPKKKHLRTHSPGESNLVYQQCLQNENKNYDR